MIRRLSFLLLSLTLLTSTAAFANQAGLVVDLGNRVITQCVEFDDPVVTALELIQLSGLDFTFDDSFTFGAAVCSVENVGCQFPQKACFCQCPSASGGCLFFALFYLQRGEWVFAYTGESCLIVHNGDVIALAWSDGTAPEVVTFAQICGTQ